MRETTEQLPGLSVRHLRWEAPLRNGLPVEDDNHPPLPADETVDLYARILTAPGGEDRPYLVFLQGGPGGESPRPATTGRAPGWVFRALEDYRVVLLDQRGTGLSCPVGSTLGPHRSAPAVTGLGEAPSPAEQAARLRHYRADAIVGDCELLREHLGVERWTVLGQSFGGFTSLHYLATHPDSLAGVMMTGGLPPVGRSAQEIYATTWQLMIQKSEQHLRRFPGDRARLEELSERAAAGELVLPNGDVVSPERFRTVGHGLGMSWGSERLHHLLERDHRSPAFAADLAASLPFGGRNPLYSVLHESSMADGVVTGWAAEASRPLAVADDPAMLAGEHLHRGVFAEDSLLAPFAEAADLLAAERWPQLYPQEALRRADVPVAAAVYTHDAYVPREFSLEAAALLPDARVWQTSEHEHDGVHASTDVLDHLIGLLHGTRWR